MGLAFALLGIGLACAGEGKNCVVDEEISRAEQILADLSSADVLASPYLISTAYYSDKFLARVGAQENGGPSRQIVAAIAPMLTPDRLQELIGRLTEAAETAVEPAPLVAPVWPSIVRRRGRDHRDAVDLFAPVGTPVVSAAPGLVVLADEGWNSADPLSTTSPKCGNSVIVFEPEPARFFRYCHLDSVAVRAGDIVRAGEQVGTVGSTGTNASRRGHGRHLHLEVHVWDGTAVRSIQHPERIFGPAIPVLPYRGNRHTRVKGAARARTRGSTGGLAGSGYTPTRH